MKTRIFFTFLVALLLVPTAWAGFVIFESAGTTPGAITSTRDAFRTAVGGGTTAGANGSFGGLRREINWDGVPNGLSDPNALPANFFNVNSPRGAIFSTPGTGFLVSANAGMATPTLFGFSNEFQTFSAQRLFTAVGSNITDVLIYLPGTMTAATTNAFAAIFVDVEMTAQTKVEFFDESNSIIFSRNVLVGGNQGLSFVGGVANAGERISRVRLTSGLDTLSSNGVRGDRNNDLVVMDDFFYAEPQQSVPEPSSVALVALGLVGCLAGLRRRHPNI